jgi:23S rRNA (guanine745-N1)-methyltransferase
MVLLDPLRCPVRGCGRALSWSERAARCGGGHAFDFARSGYLNLLQPQDKRSPEPGDSADAVRARERLCARGVEAGLRDAVAAQVRALTPALTIEVGCGTGTQLASLPPRALGFDLSAHAAAASARRACDALVVVANADRRLPVADACADVVVTIRGPKNPADFARVLRAGGRVIAGVPAADDLAELRAAVLGAGPDLPREETTIARFAPHFTLEARTTVRERLMVDPDALRDLLAGTYRGARLAARARVEALQAMELTFATELLLFVAR